MIPAMSHAATTESQQSQKCEKQSTNFASSNRDTLIRSAERVHPSNSCKFWKGEVIKHTLAEDLHLHEMTICKT